MDYELIIKGGTAILPDGIKQVDIGVNNGMIAAIEPDLAGKNIYPANDMLVIPGGIDPHVHLEMPTPITRTSEDWASGTIAAAFGGTTTVIDFIEPEGDELLTTALQKRRTEAEGHTSIDYSLHMTICKTDPGTLDQIPDVIGAGVTSFKLYTTYEGFALTDESLLAAFEAIRKVNGLAIVHSENDAIIHHSIQRLAAVNDLHPSHFPESRPAIAEVEAIRRVIALARFVGIPLYIVHVSTGTGGAAVERARQHGQEVYGETCPQYLLLNQEMYKTRDGLEAVKYICAPPLREVKDNHRLWKLLKDGGLQTIGTDHCAFNVAGQKDRGKDSFLLSPGGVPGVEARLALIYTFGVRSGMLTLQQWVSCCSSTPAKIFGLAPHKGTLAVGSDADIVLFDPNKKIVLTKKVLHEKVDYTPYEGFELEGFPRATFLRGNLLVEDGRRVCQKPEGKFVKRSVHPTIYERLTDEY